MAKKQFTSNFQDIFSPTISEENSTQTDTKKDVEKVDSTDDIVRTTILLNKSTYHTIKAIAYWERLQIKDLLQKALNSIIDSYSDEQLKKILHEFDNK